MDPSLYSRMINGPLLIESLPDDITIYVPYKSRMALRESLLCLNGGGEGSIAFVVIGVADDGKCV